MAPPELRRPPGRGAVEEKGNKGSAPSSTKRRSRRQFLREAADRLFHAETSDAGHYYADAPVRRRKSYSMAVNL